MSENSLIYSLTSRHALALNHKTLRHTTEGDIESILVPSFNLLLKRWNNPTSQGNLYFVGGYGLRDMESQNLGVGLLSLEADWEDRRYYVSAKSNWLVNSNSEDHYLRARIGFAPYLGSYEELNTWFIVQTDRFISGEVDTTPLLRFYYRNVLWEIGGSLKGHWLFNFMIHI